ncbi:hypothetical protein G647_09378 [Cladophialophora carrionii CBS 160.54]|uniref:Transcription factor domain-containing protein n=1 Tax=Cladophialophora carrionii CBS 160.54 TaxID=1279043 RepID=V9CY38_9EURO|nr:uncharacterized protein G647_09378 [Cladophialophora carrionii CBS 160.54]ETI19544.1 hypothetical protein G647_09378 [Cladophialophora carrionii CBS 160.54]
MRHAELEWTPKAATQKHKRLEKVDHPQPSRQVVDAGPFSDIQYLGLDGFDGCQAKNPPFDATMLHRLLTSMFPKPVTVRLRHQIEHVFEPTLRLAMQHEELFQAMMAMALAFQEIRSGQLFITPAIAYHSARSIACLRTKLQELETGPDDAVMITTMLLTDIAVMTLLEDIARHGLKIPQTKYGTRAEYIAHYRGLREMINMRGGPKTFVGNTPLLAMLDYADVVTEMLAIPKQPELVEDFGSDCSLGREHDISSLHYPVHPFPPDLCSDIANLPEGFRELALSLQLSREVIRLIIGASRQAFFDAEEVKSRPKIYCPSMIMTFSRKIFASSARVTEAIVCLSIVVSCLRSASFPFGKEDLQLVMELSSLAARRGARESTPDQHYHYIWTVMVAAEACEQDPLLSPIIDKLLMDLLEPTARHDLKAPHLLGEWATLEEILRRYFWRHDLLEKWKCVWAAALQKRRSTIQYKYS